MINPEKISLIRTRSNIVDIISQHLKLQKKGRNYWTICPFHEDNSPSMSISPEKQIYTCFSCQASGNVFTFLQEYKNITFLEALKEVASLVDVDLKELVEAKQSSFNEQTLNIFAINKLAMEYFMYNLDSNLGGEAKNYLHSRSIDNKLIETFKIGLSPRNNELLNYLKQKGFTLSDILATGLIYEKNNSYFDYFHSRIMFPIYSLEDNIVGFSSRVYNTNQEPKYLNTIETNIFRKSNLLYHLNDAKKYLRKDKTIIICEGFMDVISLAKLDIYNTIAIMGTSLTDNHCQMLKKITNQIILFLDGDEAGKIATMSIILKLWKYRFNVKVVNNLTTCDPDELISKEPLIKIQTMIQTAVFPLDFAISFLQSKLDLANVSNITQFLEKIKPFFLLIDNDVEISFYLNKLEQLTNLNKEVLSKNIFSNTQKNFAITNQIEKAKVNHNKQWIFNQVEKAEDIILFSLIKWKQTITDKNRQLYLITRSKKSLLQSILKWYDKNVNALEVNLKDLLLNLNQEQKAVQELIILNCKATILNYNSNLIDDCQEKIYEHITRSEIKKLKNEQNASEDFTKKLEIGQRIINLSQNIKTEKSGQ